MFEMNGIKFSHLADGFGRFSTVKFNNGKAIFTSKMLKSEYYNRSREEGSIIPTLLFAETVPPRWKSMIPALNVVHS